MPRWWDDKAEKLQASVRMNENGDPTEHGSQKIGQATVNGREDLVLIVSYLSSANRQLAAIKWLLVGLLFAAAWIADKLAR